MNKTQLNSKIKEHLSTAVFYLSILFFIIGFNFSDNAVNGWYQQFFPNIGNRQITDIFFLDSLNGWAVTNNTSPSDTGFLLCTTNSGNNWLFLYKTQDKFSRVCFISLNTGYLSGGDVYKTTNGGVNWNLLNASNQTSIEDMHVINEDTIFIADSEGAFGGVFRTTDGGANWQRTFLPNGQPNKIYFFNKTLGFASSGSTGALYRTTNTGVNWNVVTGTEGFYDIKFTDSLTGWKANGFIKKTTDGGLNWIQQVVPSGGNLIGNNINKISVINADTIWGVGSQIINGSTTRGIIYRTTNGGINWMFQVPDTAIHILTPYSYIQFYNKNIGWAYTLGFYGGIHTTTGGDAQWLTDVNQISNAVPVEFMLYQNYPNPFNPKTIIAYSISKYSEVKLVVFDITGRVITTLVDKRQPAGTYSVDFNGGSLSSGVYFYSITINTGSEVYRQTKKMLLVK